METQDETPPGRRWHDMGGRPAGPVERDEHDHALWEKRVDALMVILGRQGLMPVDALRRILEDMGEEAFETMTYYERWMAAVTQHLVETGVVTIDELNRRMAEVEARGPTYAEAQGGSS
ncbi:MAG TPA: ScnB-like protein [Thermohalobaculum sp.]|nr:ScnB-like protein [Thermohalobaculum sp.]